MNYVNPKLCKHQLCLVDRILPAKDRVHVRCIVCGLKGPVIKIGLFRFWAVARAFRGFYQLANRVDDGTPAKRIEYVE